MELCAGKPASSELLAPKSKITWLSVVVLLLCFSLNSYSQGSLKKGEDAYKAGEYFSALDYFKDAYLRASKDQRPEILFKMAECFRLINQPLKAEMWYEKALTRGITNPMATYYLAEMQKKNNKYEQARENFKKYKEMVPNDPMADEGIQSCDLAQKWMDNPSGYQCEVMKFFNSKQSDYSPSYASADYGTVFFTSSREGSSGGKNNKITGQPSADIYVSKIDKRGIWSAPVSVGNQINTEGEEGFPCVSKDFKTLYYTQCKAVKNKNEGCQIYYAEILDNGFGKSNVIKLADDSIVVAHPAISADNLILYFTSDMPGGQGGKDIWKVTRASVDGQWGAPVNLGPQINTKRDEMFPYVHDDGTLYFSSNGLAGLGGLDIFKAKPQTDGSWKVENMGFPINSNADDFGIIFQKDEEKGFFSSSRSEKGDDDIYAFALPPLRFSIIGSVKDEKSAEPLAEAKIKCISSDGITAEIKTDKNGVFRMPLKANTDYVFIASQDGYLNGKQRESTKGLDKSKDFKPSILLTSIARPIELPNIFYDFAKWDLRPESMAALDKLVETLNDNPTVTIELMSHTDARGNENDNLILSQKRAQSVVNYLIEKGIDAERLQAKGYGKSSPKVVDKKLSDQYSFLKEGVTLSEPFINSLADSDLQEIAHQINRRTEFRVLRTDYKKK